MARPRLELHAILKAITPNVYFQPPNNIIMVYPCIVYERDNVDIRHADNRPYSTDKRYTITVIDRNPDSAIPDAIAQLPMSAFSTAFQADDLNHDVYTLYF